MQYVTIRMIILNTSMEFSLQCNVVTDPRSLQIKFQSQNPLQDCFHSFGGRGFRFDRVPTASVCLSIEEVTRHLDTRRVTKADSH